MIKIWNRHTVIHRSANAVQKSKRTSHKLYRIYMYICKWNILICQANWWTMSNERQCNRTIRHTIYFVQRLAKHRIVYKSQITPNLAHVRLTLPCINMIVFEYVCLLLPPSNVSLHQQRTNIRARAHFRIKIFTFIWFGNFGVMPKR